MKKVRVLSLLLTVSLVFALTLLTMTYTRMKNAERMMARMYELGMTASCERLEEIHIGLDKLLVTQDRATQAQMLGSVSRLAAQVQSELTPLQPAQPVLLSATQMTGELCSDVQAMLASLQNGASLTESQLERLRGASADCSLLAGQLALWAQENALQPLRASAAQELFDAPVLLRDQPVGLPANTVTAEEAMTIAAQVVGEGRVRRVLPFAGTSGVLPAHGAVVETPDLQLNLEITQQGGQLLWMMPETASFPVLLSAQECRAAAERFMQRLGYPDMAIVAWQRYDGLFVAAYAPLQDGVLLYPDLVHVQVRMDTGEAVGFESAAYWTHHIRRDLPQAALTTDEAEALVSSHAQVQSARLCVIARDRAEVLCHQVHASSDGDHYYVYINAETGHTEAVQKLIIDENGIRPA